MDSLMEEYESIEELGEDLYDRSLIKLMPEDEDGTYLPHQDRSVDADAYLRTVIDIQFDEEYGAPYWREVAEDLDFDPREEIHGFDDLRRLPEADETDIKERSVEDFIPELFYTDGTPDTELFDLSKSSGTTGRKKIMPWRKTLSDEAVEWYTYNLEERDHTGGDWLVAGPYGLYEKHIEGMANANDGFAHFTGLETRKLKEQLRDFGQLIDEPLGFMKDAGTDLPTSLWSAAKGGLRGQRMLQVLEEDLLSEDISNLATHPTVAERLYDVLTQDETVSDPDDIQTLLVSGAAMDSDTLEDLGELYSNAEIIPMYATSFTGPAFDEPKSESIDYYSPAPFVTFDVLEPGATYAERESAKEGQRGQVVINRVAEDFFWPNQTERETAERTESDDRSGTGLTDIRPL